MSATRAFGLLLLLALTGCASSSPSSSKSLDERCLYHPLPYPQGEWKKKDPGIEEAVFQAADGTQLHGWFAAPPTPPRAVVLYCHGNAGNVTTWQSVLKEYRDHLNCAILVFDYRGYGKSQGEPHEAGILMDGRAARRWLAQRTGVAEKDIVLVGRSLGGAVAVDLACDGARALVLENTFTSVPELAACHVPFLPAEWCVRTQLDSRSKIKDYEGPLLQTHGTADRTIPFALGKRLHHAANDPKVFIQANGGDHNDPPSEQYLWALDRLLNQVSLQAR